jgi:A/G-specific adenine glycosylase
VSRLQRTLLQWYRKHGRRSLPWRATRDPYRTVVSEFMLAQTQVDRVVPKFVAFVARFPDFRALAGASTADVVREWKGLGYNSRAVRLHRLAAEVLERHGNVVPSGGEALRALPGIGPYTASAIRAFAFNLDEVAIDVNVRRVMHRLFVGLEHPVAAPTREVETRARAALPRGHAHDWNSALMDLGATICTARAPKCILCPVRAHCAAAPIEPELLERARAARPDRRSPQADVPFRQTTRYARGRIVDRLRELPPGAQISLLDLYDSLEPALTGRTFDDVQKFVGDLERDGLVTSDGTQVALRE